MMLPFQRDAQVLQHPLHPRHLPALPHNPPSSSSTPKLRLLAFPSRDLQHSTFTLSLMSMRHLEPPSASETTSVRVIPLTITLIVHHLVACTIITLILISVMATRASH
eukprot:2514421-Rhodomonas_salina.2